MCGAALAFGAYALFAGLIVPAAPYGRAPWHNYNLVREVTGAPIQIWRTLSAIAVTVFVVRALDIFEFERKQQLDTLARKRQQAEKTLLASELRFQRVFEHASIGMDIVSVKGRPLRANRALQEMLGYSESDLQARVFADCILILTTWRGVCEWRRTCVKESVVISRWRNATIVRTARWSLRE